MKKMLYCMALSCWHFLADKHQWITSVETHVYTVQYNASTPIHHIKYCRKMRRCYCEAVQYGDVVSVDDIPISTNGLTEFWD